MITLCTDPTCDADAQLTIQLQSDTAPVGFCLEHGYRREAELKQRLENYRLVTIARQAPTELELAQARIAELEDAATRRFDGIISNEADVGEQLETALHTLELQGKSLQLTGAELRDTKRELELAQRELARTRRELEQARAGGGTPPLTPVPPTRPDPK